MVASPMSLLTICVTLLLVGGRIHLLAARSPPVGVASTEIPGRPNCDDGCRPECYPSIEQTKVLHTIFHATAEAKQIHFRWHFLMEHWTILNDNEKNLTHQALGPQWTNPPVADSRDSLYGENFFTFHHYWWWFVKHAMDASGICMIPGWEEFPAADDPQFTLNFTGSEAMPVRQDTFEFPLKIDLDWIQLEGDAWSFVTDILKQNMFRTPIISTEPLPLLAIFIRAYAASDDTALHRIRAAGTKLKDPNYLRNITLGRHGFEVVNYIHGPMHARMTMLLYQRAQWDNIRPQLRFEEILGIDQTRTKNPAWLWNDPGYYDYMFDGYADQAAPSFWKLHGFIQAQLNRWLEANGYERGAVDCDGDPKCYTWRTSFGIDSVRDEIKKQDERPGTQHGI